MLTLAVNDLGFVKHVANVNAVIAVRPLTSLWGRIFFMVIAVLLMSQFYHLILVAIIQIVINIKNGKMIDKTHNKKIQRTQKDAPQI